MQKVTIIDYGAGNLASLRNAFKYLDVPVEITSDAVEIRNAEKLVLPGVGAFGPAMDRLRDSGIADAIMEQVEQGTILLGICLGMQLLFTTSYEQGKHNGLDLIPGDVQKFNGVEKVPHMGWNILKPAQDADPLLAGTPEPAYVYFVHSYYCIPASPEYTIALSDYGNPFAAAVRNDRVWGMQYHPEKSQDVGLTMLQNFANQE
ncbi:MAG: imidazole glycerol phosphate synthase subunit HisH [Candidatus Marinimicrobia bacterium]|nr:imidazole glycerol phosphate synthase subunit HisH [Candidatus Neomarinimicrobiota bacterium]MCF7827585.1 imidazole glycerol phosphate synthase subunit HisH [Candidatus Neomarinimicrobiota bacterium]MCF7881553.1 imidazole glycerol phosphate synthase subunit HisH [Candidatus Neomarinimicrobiota bacterium]